MPIENGLCKCNRPLDRPHCPACGSRTVVYVKRNSRVAKIADGTEKIMRGFVCRACGQQFQEDWICGAPIKPIGRALRGQSPLDKAMARIERKNPHLTRGGFQQNLLEQLAKINPTVAAARAVTTSPTNDEDDRASRRLTDTTGDAMFGGGNDAKNNE